MTDTNVSGDGGNTPLPELGQMGYRATLGTTKSKVFSSREEARAWIEERRAARNDHDSSSRLEEFEV